MAADIPKTMRVVEAAGLAIDRLRLVERPVPEPRCGEILIRLAAATLNYRDVAILTGRYRPGLQLDRPFIPASDGCGTVVALGPEVTRFALGDRVVPVYTQGWIDGRPTPEMRTQHTIGFPLDGVLCEYIAVPARDAVHAPASLSDLEAATLPIAGLTAWTTLQEACVKPGDWVLAMGTGGVAIFALQFAKLAGARVAVISSSDDKLARARQLGADATVNYRTTPDWVAPVRQATGGRGVDIVIETAGTLAQSLAAAAFGAYVGVVGFTQGHAADLDVRQIIGPMIRIHGIAVGSRTGFEAMNRAIAQHALRPVVDRVFPLDRVQDAFALMARGGHFGKIAIAIAPTETAPRPR
jgi:NADPH:quinone reductase-like Zn-dependent oxidoreductase